MVAGPCRIACHDGHMPFADYDDFDDCVAQNQDKSDPDAYCGKIKAEAEMAADHPVDLDAVRKRRHFQIAEAKTRHPTARRKPRTFHKPS